MLELFSIQGVLFTFSHTVRELLIVAAAAYVLHLLLPGSGRLTRERLFKRPQIENNLLYTFLNAVVFAPLFLIVMLWMTDEFASLYSVRGREMIDTWPWWVQFLAATYLTDLVAYWRHRIFHSKPLWNIHAAHHSAPDLYWLVTGRTHPINAFAASLLFTLVPYCLGFPLEVSAAAVLARKYWAYLIHSNMLSWDFGPLRHVIVSPLFHAWHHSSEDDALDKNYAGVFAFHDLLFGSFFLPKGRLPLQFGVQDPDYPEGFLTQLAYPFRHAIAPSHSPVRR